MDTATHAHRNLIAILAVICLLPAACNTGDTGGDDGTVAEQGDTRHAWQADAEGDAVDEEDDVSTELEPVECGEMTCGSDEYCVVTEGCGADVGFNDAGEWRGCGSPFYTCESIPDSCDPTSLCDCDEVPRCVGGTCDDNRHVTCYAR